MIRKAEEKDVSRIAEILVFDKRVHYRSIFHNDDFSFNELQVVSTAESYKDPTLLSHTRVYDDGIVKGMIHIEGKEIKELYVDWFFEHQGIGAQLIEYAKTESDVKYLWCLAKNTAALQFYHAHGFMESGIRKYEEGTSEYLVCMERK